MKRFLYSTLMRVRPAPLAVFFKRLLGVRREPFTARHATFYVDPVSNFGYRLMKDGVYEEEIVEIMREKLVPGGVFYDVGANEGYFTCVAGKIVGPTGLVVSVEPQSRLFTVVEKNTQLNDLTNVNIVRTAVGKSEGSGEMFLSPDINTGSSGMMQVSKYRRSVETVQITTLDKLTEKLGTAKIDLMKIDIESFEWEAVLGSKKLFQSQSVKNIVIEIHNQELARRGKCAGDIAEFLMSCGYSAAQRGEVHFFTAVSR